MRKLLILLGVLFLFGTGISNASNVYIIYTKLITANGFRSIPLYIDTKDESLNASTNYRSITVNQGLLNTVTEDELAFVLGHELAHVHYRAKEKGADIISLTIGRRAGYNVCSGGVKYFKRLIRTYGDSEDKDHPRTSSRIRYIKNACGS